MTLADVLAKYDERDVASARTHAANAFPWSAGMDDAIRDALAYVALTAGAMELIKMRDFHEPLKEGLLREAGENLLAALGARLPKAHKSPLLAAILVGYDE